MCILMEPGKDASGALFFVDFALLFGSAGPTSMCVPNTTTMSHWKHNLVYVRGRQNGGPCGLVEVRHKVATVCATAGRSTSSLQTWHPQPCSQNGILDRILGRNAPSTGKNTVNAPPHGRRGLNTSSNQHSHHAQVPFLRSHVNRYEPVEVAASLSR